MNMQEMKAAIQRLDGDTDRLWELNRAQLERTFKGYVASREGAEVLEAMLLPSLRSVANDLRLVASGNKNVVIDRILKA